MYKFLPLVFLLSILLLGCQRKPYTAENLPDLQLRFGNGGGFTGAVTTYTLLQNGQLFRNNSFDNITLQLGLLNVKEAKALFKEATALELAEKQVNKPSNIYYFITLQDKKMNATYTWGDPEFTADHTIQAFYKKLTDITKNAQAPIK